MSPKETPQPSGKPPLGGISPSWPTPTPSLQTGQTPPSGNLPLGGISPSWPNSNTSLQTGQALPSGNSAQQSEPQPYGILVTGLEDIPEEDRIDWEEQMDESPSEPLPSSSDPSQPLSGAPAMDAELDAILSGAPASRTDKMPVGGGGPARQLAELIAKKQVEDANKLEADKAAELGQTPRPRPEKRDRTVTHNPQPESSKRIRTDQPTPVADVMDMRQENPAKNRPTDFSHLIRPGRLPCAVSIDGGDIMGDPFSTTPGWDLKVSLEPGTLGLPSIGLDFLFAKDGGDFKKPGNQNSFALGWEPGVKIGGKWMIEDLVMVQASKPPNQNVLEATFPTSIRNLLAKSGLDYEKTTDRLVCATFRSNVHKSTLMNMAWVKALKGNAAKAPHDNLARIYHGKDTGYQVTMWFWNRSSSLESFRASCLNPLAQAVTDHTPPLHQYLDDDDQPFIDFGLPSIHAIGNGMYQKYPKMKDATGKRIVNRSVPPTYMNLPKTVTWDSIRTFHITSGVSLVRDLQYNEGLHARLGQGWHSIFLQRMPDFGPEGKQLNPTAKWKDTFRAGIRMRRDPKTGLKDAVPPLNSAVLLDFYNGNVDEGREHSPIKENYCFGHVTNLGGRAWLEQTKTDFCVLITKPRGLKGLFSYKEAKACSEDKLLRANVKVRVNHEATQRDMKGLKRFCDENYAPELLNHLRLAFWSDPSKVPEEIDLTKGPAHNRSDENSEKYKALIEELQKSQPMNDSQLRVLKSASEMKSRIVAVQGPPGAGKTLTLRNKVIAMTKIGHKSLVVAPSNVAVDTAARAVWDGLSEEERKTIRCLRLETDGAERAQRLTRRAYGQFTGEPGEEDKMPEYYDPKEAQDHPAIRNALDKLVLQVHTRQQFAEKMFQKYNDMNDAYLATQKYEDLKQSNVNIGITLEHRIWEITVEDRAEAGKLYEEARSRLTPAEYDNLVINGQMNIAMYNKSARYLECISHYVRSEGRVNKAEKVALQDETDRMVERVLARTDILFTTASNCGGALLSESKSFEPSVIFCDEAGQISIPSICVPLTTFTKWEGLFLFGDVQQLEPTVFSGQFNEFVQNAKVSPLALLEMKGFKPILLEEQYRMAAACSAFPRSQFYDGLGLKDSDAVKVDNDVRRTVRKWSRGLGVEGDNKEGSEYIVTNVAHGCSRVELNGTSLVNHANADVIVRMVGELIKTQVVTASMVKILSYYQGQRRLIQQKIASSPWPQEIKKAIEVSTVDSFQGRESAVIFVDTVAAKDNLVGPLNPEMETPEDAEDLGTEDYIKVGAVTGHVRNPNRLNVALTRGKDSTIVICQAGLLATTYKKGRGKHANALSNMIGDAETRDCLFTDSTEDTHPDSVQARAEKGEKQVGQEREKHQLTNLGFIAQGKMRWRDMKNLPAIHPAPQPQLYRVPGGHTTRPIGDANLVARADAYDEEQRQMEAAAEESKTMEAIRLEDERLLNLGVQQSLESAQGESTSEHTTAMDTKVDEEARVDTGAEMDDGFESPPEDSGDDNEDDIVGEGFAGLNAGVEDSQF